jgi:hypothetical protein
MRAQDLVFSKDKKLINDMELERELGIVFGEILVRFGQILEV